MSVKFEKVLNLLAEGYKELFKNLLEAWTSSSIRRWNGFHNSA